MIEEQVEMRTADGTADGFLYRHEGESRLGVIHLTDIGGIRSSQKAMAPTSPHLLLPRIKARLYFGHAVEDRGMPPEAIDRLDQALAAWEGRYESEVYDGARHGWTVPDSPVFNGPQAERAFAKLKELFAESLGAA